MNDLLSQWVPLHFHSQYSILDAACSVEGIAKKAEEYKISAVALTDHGNLHGAVDFYKACKAHKIKPIIGCELYIAPESRFEKKKASQTKNAYHLILLAKDQEGYRNLCKLSSLGYTEGFYYHPRVDKELLSQYHKGLICLSGCLSSQLAQAALYGSEEDFIKELRWHHDLFKEDYYLELQRHQMSEEKLKESGFFQETWLYQNYQDFIDKQNRYNLRLIEASRQTGIKLVATNDTHYIDQSDWQAHEILLNIQSGEPCEIWEKDSYGNDKFRIPNPKRRVYPTHECYFKSPEEMAELFSDIPEALSNTTEVANKCCLSIDFDTKHYPVYIPPSLEGKEFSKEERVKAAEKFLKDLCQESIQKRYTQEALEHVAEKYPGKNSLQVVYDRLDYEMSIIVPKGMCDYLLIVYDFINWAKQNGIPMGPGRGSGAGSIILYLIGITDIEPLRFDLFFERFINPERLSYPDIDVDICMDRRGDVIDYTLKKYGKSNIAQIITFGTMKAKMTIKDVGRVLSVPLTKVNAIAKLVPEDPNMTLTRALEMDVDLHQMVQADEDARRIIEIGKKLEGSIRNTGIHAAGLIICGDPLVEHIPVCLAKDSDIVATQYSMKPVELVGMLKIDFLGLKTLTSIKIAVDWVKGNFNKDIDWINLPLNDSATFQLLKQGRTLGVFQMESGGMQELARQLHPDKFEEIIAIGALYRPGPMDMIPSFINRKHGKEPIEYDHPWMEAILAETYGIMVYQEQVMQIAQKLANYSLGEGDVLRRAMGKKDAAQMAKEREKFRKGAVENNISDEIATAIFDKMEKFASYGFNKSHAAAYGYLTYVTSYLKANYPHEWMAALMTCDRDDLSKVAKFIRECQTMNILILPPDINEASSEFVPTAQGIRFAMTGIKGVGEGVVFTIIEERKKRGPFKSLYDFLKRVDAKKVGKKVVESLIAAGCFDFTGWSRDALTISVDEMHETVSRDQKEAASGFINMFSLMGDQIEKRFHKPPEVLNRTPNNEIYHREKELLGFYLTGHPMDSFKELLPRLSCVELHLLESLDHQSVARTAFIIESVQIRIAAKTQRKFAILMISDGIESLELPVWSDLYEEHAPLLKENQLVYAVLQIDKREEPLKLNCRWLSDLTKVDEKVIEDCDLAYDRAKMQINRSNHFTKEKKQESGSLKNSSINEVKNEKKILFIEMDADKARLSHILRVKTLLTESRGSVPVHIQFTADKKIEAKLEIDESFSIQFSDILKDSLMKIDSIKMIELKSVIAT